MASPRYHLVSFSEPPKLRGAYIYSLEDAETGWTQESDWLALVLDHAGTFIVGARTQVYAPWSLFVVPPGNRCRLHPAPSPDVRCAFWMRFLPAETGVPRVALPAYAELGDMGPLWDRRLRSTLNRAYQMQKETPVVLGDLLWSVAQDPGSVRQSHAVEAAERFVEENLHRPIRVEEVAEHAGVSHNQLIRLFRAEHGVSPLEYIRHRRQHAACRMILETEMPIKEVAAAVGIVDLGQFNRLVQAAAGMSPRRLRATVRPPDLFRSSR